MSTDQTPSNAERLILADDFDRPDLAEWRAAVAKVLNRGRPEDKLLSGEASVDKLRTTTVDGLVIDPLYTHADAPGELGVPGVAPFTRGTTVRGGAMDAWDVRALHEDPDVARTKEAVNNDLTRGATSLWFRLDDDAIAPSDLEADLDQVLLNLITVEVSSRANQAAAAEALLAVYAKSSVAPEEASFSLGIDPIGEAAYTGRTPELSALASWVERVKGYPKAHPIVIDVTGYHNGGAGDVHEVAYALATGAEYLRVLTEAGLSPDEAALAISFRVSATCDQFSTIARLRALRRCWSRVCEVFGVSEENRGARQHAVTSWREITRDDPYVNVLRGSISTFGAAVGSAEAITVLPLDTAWGLPSEAGRRIARNTQIVLAEESNIGRVNDPAGGSWYVEKLTALIAQAAWVEFQTVETAGGMAKALTDGLVAKALDQLKAERSVRLAKRTKPITGVSEFPKIDETPLTVAPRPQEAARTGLVWARDAAVFEQLRDRVAAASGAPQVFLACLGTRRDFGGREGFASNLFQVAGLPTPSTEGGTLDEIVAAFRAANTPVACLCSSAKVYAEQGLAAAKALKEAGASKLILAGNFKEFGGDQGEAQSLIDSAIAMGVDVVDTLESVLAQLGVAK